MSVIAYYESTGADSEWEYLRPTEHTASVWSPEIQHGGPPSGLLARTIATTVGATAPEPAALTMTRLTVDILGAIGLSANRIRGYVIRPGRQIAMYGAELQTQAPDRTWRTTARASAWMHSRADTSAIAESPQPITLPGDSVVNMPEHWDSTWGTTGFIASIDLVPHATGDDGLPANTMWLRPRGVLIDGEPITPLAAFVTMVDVANGLGSTQSPSQWTWMNTDTTIHLRRQPVGLWTAISATMRAGEAGYGYTEAQLADTEGILGRSAQTILIRPTGA